MYPFQDVARKEIKSVFYKSCLFQKFIILCVNLRVLLIRTRLRVRQTQKNISNEKAGEDNKADKNSKKVTAENSKSGENLPKTKDDDSITISDDDEGNI